MFPAIESQVLVVVGLAVVATYSLRFGGLLLASRLPKTGRFRQGMDALPGTLLFSLVIPGLASEGFWGLSAGGLTALVVWRTGNTFLAMLVGMSVIYLFRTFIG